MKKQPSDMLSGAAKDKLEEIRSFWEMMRECPRCKGSGTNPYSEWEVKNHPELAGQTKTCVNCRGVGQFMRPDIISILNDVATVQKGKMQLRSTRPKFAAANAANRAYYVWRIARFSGGVDVTMPVMASAELCQDPYIKELEAISDSFAKLFFGTDMAGALRWGPLIGGITSERAEAYMKQNPQPMTAHECGPVVIGEKPKSESPEIDDPEE